MTAPVKMALSGLVPVPESVKADFCMLCPDNSMIGCRILPGDVVYIRQQDDVADGQLAAIMLDDARQGGAAMLRRVYKIGADRLALHPENPAYKSMMFTGTERERVRILGLAVAFASPLNTGKEESQ